MRALNYFMFVFNMLFFYLIKIISVRPMLFCAGVQLLRQIHIYSANACANQLVHRSFTIAESNRIRRTIEK